MDITKKRMKHTAFILFFSLMTYVCLAQEQQLKPVRDFSQYRGIQKEYFDNVLPVLHKGYAEKPIARYTVIPSFSNEYSFSIEIIQGKNMS